MAVAVRSDAREVVTRILAIASTREEAVESLVAHLETNEHDRHLVADFYRPMSLVQIAKAAINREAQLARGPGAGWRADVAGAIARGETYLARIERWALEGGEGVKLLAATRTDLENAVAWHETRIAGHERDCSFYQAIMAKLRPEQAVIAKWTPESLAELLQLHDL